MMKLNYFDFNPFGTQSIIVKFDCDNCSQPVESEEIFIPSPNYAADTASDSQTDNEGYATCGNCDKSFEIDVYVTYAGGSGHVNDLPEDQDVFVDEIDEPYYEDQFEAITSNTEFFETFNKELDNIKLLLSVEPKDEAVKKILHRQMYSGVIGTMETYLSDAFINTVFKTEESKRSFFKTFRKFGRQKITVSAFYDFQDKVNTVARDAMLEVIYHNLPKVSNMYKDTLGVSFPKFEEIYEAVLMRHDMVHRSGKTKKGEEVIVNSKSVEDLIEKVRTFIIDIDNQLP